jgi:protein tyrosine/serine phosphatase
VHRVTLDWPDCENVRDLGGLPTTDGGRIRDGALIRADGLFRLTPAGVAAVRRAGVVRILDLRWRAECELAPSPFASDPIHLHLPLLADVLSYEAPHDTYAPMLDHNRERIRLAFRALAAAPPGGVVVHCHGGRDRTAVLVALALAVAGVPDEEIVADYALSPERDALAMRNTLAHLAGRYGGAEGYLLTIGVPPADVEAVRRRLR